MSSYKNTTANDLWLSGVGMVKAGETFETNLVIENPNFELVTESTPVPSQAAPAPQAADLVAATQEPVVAAPQAVNNQPQVKE